MRGLAASVLLAFAWSATAGEFRSIAENGTPMYDAPSVRAKKLFVASRQYPVEVRALDSHAPTHPQRGQRPLIDPIADGLLVQLQYLRHLGDGQKRIFGLGRIHLICC